MNSSLPKKAFAFPIIAYSLLIILLLAMGVWLTYDFWCERGKRPATAGFNFQ